MAISRLSGWGHSFKVFARLRTQSNPIRSARHLPPGWRAEIVRGPSYLSEVKAHADPRQTG